MFYARLSPAGKHTRRDRSTREISRGPRPAPPRARINITGSATIAGQSIVFFSGQRFCSFHLGRNSRGRGSLCSVACYSCALLFCSSFISLAYILSGRRRRRAHYSDHWASLSFPFLSLFSAELDEIMDGANRCCPGGALDGVLLQISWLSVSRLPGSRRHRSIQHATIGVEKVMKETNRRKRDGNDESYGEIGRVF